MKLTPEQLRSNAAAMVALSHNEPIEVLWNGRWESYGGEPKDWHLFEYRPKPEPVTRKWSKPEDVPKVPVIWIKQGVSEWMVICVCGAGVHTSQSKNLVEWSELNIYEYSTDRKTWHKCEVTEVSE